MKTLHIFKPGRHTPMAGGSINFSESDLAASARAYDPDIHEAPIVIGHPAADAPAHGWVGGLLADTTGLRAVPRQVDPAFAEAVKKGAFKKISASFYAPDSPNNPVPGVYYLRHVGFLGAQPPAVKGLERVDLADGEQGVVNFEEGEEESGTGLFAKLRAWLIKNKGEEAANDLLPEDKVKALTEDAPASAAAPAADVSPEDSADDVVEELTEQVTAQAEQIRKLTQEKESLEEEQANTGSGESASFVESLVRDGRIKPRHRAVVLAFMEAASGRTKRTKDGVVSFGEGADARPLLPAFRGFLATLPKSVEFSELATKTRANSQPSVNPLVADAQRRAKAGR